MSTTWSERAAMNRNIAAAPIVLVLSSYVDSAQCGDTAMPDLKDPKIISASQDLFTRNTARPNPSGEIAHEHPNSRPHGPQELSILSTCRWAMRRLEK